MPKHDTRLLWDYDARSGDDEHQSSAGPECPSDQLIASVDIPKVKAHFRASGRFAIVALVVLSVLCVLLYTRQA